MLVFIKGGNMQPLSFACDAVENLTGARCLDGAFGYGNDLVRAALKETATDSALLTGSKRTWGPQPYAQTKPDLYASAWSESEMPYPRSDESLDAWP